MKGKTSKKVKTFNVSSETRDIFIFHVWDGIAAMDDLASSLLKEGRKEASTKSLLHLLRKSVDRQFAENDGLAVKSTWSNSDSELYAATLEPLSIFLDMVDQGDRDNGDVSDDLISLSRLAIPLKLLADRGIAFFRSCLNESKAGAA